MAVTRYFESNTDHPAWTLNGVNLLFTLDHEPDAGSLIAFINGTVTACEFTGTTAMVYVAPWDTDSILFTYTTGETAGTTPETWPAVHVTRHAGAVLVNNLISGDITITPSTEDAAYPKANLYDRQAANVFKGTSLTTLTILLDFGVPVTADTIALINHNLTEAGSVSLTADSTSPPTTVVGAIAYREHDSWDSFPSTTAQYWELTIADANTANLQIGQLILGVRTGLPRNRRIGNYSPTIRRANISGETYAGAIFRYHLFERKVLNPSFRVATASELAVFTALDAAVFGNLYPFLYIPDVLQADCYYVRKEQDYEPQEIARIASGEIAHDYQMTVIEESRGLEVVA